jgi:hypothetical protein
MGFQDLPFDPRCAMMVRMIDLQRYFAGKSEGVITISWAWRDQYFV